jgi:small subunit ribosomal protein S20
MVCCGSHFTAFQVSVSIDIKGVNDQNARLPSHKARDRHSEEPYVANSKQSAKRARQGEKRRQHNVALRSRMRTAIKSVLTAVQDGNTDEANTLYKAAVPQIDTMVNKGLVHKNKAARTKSRLNARIRGIGA